jgi:hypothetical protein
MGPGAFHTLMNVRNFIVVPVSLLSLVASKLSDSIFSGWKFS